jgi:5-methylcytosine-specific restriction endonuclease McrA
VGRGLCRKHYAREWRAEQPPGWRHEIYVKTKAKDTEKILAQGREQTRRWREAHPEESRARTKVTRERFPERTKAAIKKWRDEHPDQCAALRAKRRSRKLAAQGSHTGADRLAVFELHGWRCSHCAADLLALPPKDRTMDHVIPLRHGGTDDTGNLVAMCRSCNCRKKDRATVHG